MYALNMKSQQKLVIAVSILASFIAFMDGSIVNVALPAIVRDLGGGLAVQQWVVDAYLLTLGSLILLAGSLSDLFGRKKILAAGLIGFGVTSLLCAVAPTSAFLITARALQGAAGALIVPKIPLKESVTVSALKAYAAVPVAELSAVKAAAGSQVAVAEFMPLTPGTEANVQL